MSRDPRLDHTHVPVTTAIHPDPFKEVFSMRRLFIPHLAMLMTASVAAAQKVTLTYLVDNT